MDRFMRMFSHSVISINSAGNLIVVKTITGSASIAGEAIDSLRWPEVIGSIAGDNTIFVAIRNIDDVPAVIDKLRGMMK